MTDVMADTALPGLLPQSPPTATTADRMELLRQLRDRRRELVESYAVGLDPAEPLAPSAVQPLAVVQAAIEAIMALEAELDEQQ